MTCTGQDFRQVWKRVFWQDWKAIEGSTVSCMPAALHASDMTLIPTHPPQPTAPCASAPTCAAPWGVQEWPALSSVTRGSTLLWHWFCTVTVRQATSSWSAPSHPPALLTLQGKSVGCCLPDARSVGLGAPPRQGCTDLWGYYWSSKAAAACSDSPPLYLQAARTPGCLQMHSGTWG